MLLADVPHATMITVRANKNAARARYDLAALVFESTEISIGVQNMGAVFCPSGINFCGGDIQAPVVVFG